MFRKKIYNYKLNTLGIEYFKRVTLRSGARIDRAVECNGTPEHDDFFVRLIYARVKWATHNFQLPFNPSLDANGYQRGGFGAGTTNLTSSKWNGYNGYNPFIPCGYTAEFGNGSGVKDFVMPFEYDGYNTTLVLASQRRTRGSAFHFQTRKK